MGKAYPVIRFLAVLVPLLLIVFLVHTYLLQHLSLPQYGNKIVLSYTVNFLMATVIFIGLYAFRNRMKTQIGFLFMAGSLLKFIVFFVLLYPSYKADGEMDSSEFAAFFIPYAICLIVETVSMVKMLQKMD